MTKKQRAVLVAAVLALAVIAYLGFSGRLNDLPMVEEPGAESTPGPEALPEPMYEPEPVRPPEESVEPAPDSAIPEPSAVPVEPELPGPPFDVEDRSYPEAEGPPPPAE